MRRAAPRRALGMPFRRRRLSARSPLHTYGYKKGAYSACQRQGSWVVRWGCVVAVARSRRRRRAPALPKSWQCAAAPPAAASSFNGARFLGGGLRPPEPPRWTQTRAIQCKPTRAPPTVVPAFPKSWQCAGEPPAAGSLRPHISPARSRRGRGATRRKIELQSHGGVVGSPPRRFQRAEKAAARRRRTPAVFSPRSPHAAPPPPDAGALGAQCHLVAIAVRRGR